MSIKASTVERRFNGPNCLASTLSAISDIIHRLTSDSSPLLMVGVRGIGLKSPCIDLGGRDLGMGHWSMVMPMSVLMMKYIIKTDIQVIAEYDYSSRLAILDLDSLESRRLHQDLVLIYKIISGLVNVDSTKYFTICRDSVTRGHSCRLIASKCRVDVRKCFFLLKELLASGIACQPLLNILPIYLF
jgi:hypothetical protein